MSFFNVRFITKQSDYAIPSDPYQLQGTLSSRELNDLVNTILKETHDSWIPIKLSFLIGGKLLRTTLDDHLREEEENFNQENELEIEYLLSEQSPKPLNSCMSDDWISSVHLNSKLIINGCYDGVINIWEIEKCNHILSIPAHASAVKVVKWINPDFMNKNDDADTFYFASCSNDETIIIWNWVQSTNKLDPIFIYKGHLRSVDCLDVRKELLVSGSYDRMLKVWSLTDDEENDEDIIDKKRPKLDFEEKKSPLKTPMVTLSGHSEAVTGVVWLSGVETKDSGMIDLASCSIDNTIKLWDLEMGKLCQTLEGSKAFLSIDHSPISNCLITSSCDRHIRLWDPRSTEGSFVKSVFTSHQGWVSCVKWSINSQHHFVSGSYDNLVKYWDIRSTKAPLFDLMGHEDKILCVDWSNKRYICSGSVDTHLKLYECTD